VPKDTVYTRTALLAIVFLSLHLTDDVLRKADGADKGGFTGLLVLLVMVVWVYGILWLAERKSGYIISLIASLMTSVIPIAHIMGLGGDALPGEIAASSGPFFVWVVFGIGVTAISAAIFSAYLLLRPSTASSSARGR
jgi:hypothetical protein